MNLRMNNIYESGGITAILLNLLQSSLQIIAGLPLSNISILITLIFSVIYFIWKIKKIKNENKLKKLELIQKLDDCRKAGIDTSSVE